MAEEVGGIVYEVGMDVKGLKAGQQSADKALGELESSLNKTTGEFNKLDKGARNAGGGMKSAGGSANSLKTSITTLAGAISVALVMEWGKAFLTVADNMTQLQARITRLSTDAATAKQTFSDLAAISSRTGASLSDTTKLWESLTSSLREAGATNAQVLNLTDTLQKIGRIGGSSTEEMANALRQFGQSIASGTIRAEEFNSILEQMPELARQIATGLGMSMGQLRQAMLDGKLTAQDALNAIQDRTGAVNAEFDKLPRSLSQATGSLETSFAKLVASIDSATGASQAIVTAIDTVSRSIDALVSSSSTWADKLLIIARVMAIFNPVLSTAVAIFDELNTKNPAITVAEQLAEDMKAVTSETKKADDATKHFKVTSSSPAKKGGKAGGKSTEEKQAESIAEKLEQLRQKSMLAATSTAELSREQQILTAQQSLGKGASEDQIQLAGQYAAQAYDVAAALKAQQKAEKDKQDTTNSFIDLRKKASPVSGLDDQFATDMANLKTYGEMYPEEIARVEQTRANIEKQYREQRIAAMWDEWSEQNAATQAAAAAFDSLGSTASNALTGILTGSMSVSDAMRNIGMTVLNSVINTFVQMGIEWVKSAIMGQAAQIAAIGTVTAVQTAAVGTQTAVSTAAAATTAAAWTPAAILSSIASMGTAAAIGLGAVAGVIGTSLLGKRKNGGPVTAGGMYQVGEGNAPEIFQASTGRQYMIPGDGGKVISNKDMMSGTGGVSGGLVIYNNVYNSTSSNVSTSATDNGDGSVTIDTIVADIEENGPIGAAISRNYTANRRATE